MIFADPDGQEICFVGKHYKLIQAGQKIRRDFFFNFGQFKFILFLLNESTSPGHVYDNIRCCTTRPDKRGHVVLVPCQK